MGHLRDNGLDHNGKKPPVQRSGGDYSINSFLLDSILALFANLFWVFDTSLLFVNTHIQRANGSGLRAWSNETEELPSECKEAASRMPST